MRYLSLSMLLIILVGPCLAANDFNYSRLEEIQEIEGNASKWLYGYADILNATPDIAPKIIKGDYESSKYVVPIGPYKASFELRSPLSYFGVSNFTHEEDIGSGKKYHNAEYTVYSMIAGNITNITYVNETWDPENYTTIKNGPDRIVQESPFHLQLYIIHYTGPESYPATEPTELIYDELLSVPSSWDTGDIWSNDIEIDGKPGREIYEDKVSKKGRVLAYHYEYIYGLDPETVIVILTCGDWDYNKDLALFKETLHISDYSL